MNIGRNYSHDESILRRLTDGFAISRGINLADLLAEFWMETKTITGP